MRQQWQQRDWVRWAGWVSACSMGWGICLINITASAMAQADQIGGSALNLLPHDMLDFTGSLGVIWGLVSLIQGLIFRSYIRQTVWWIPGWVLVSTSGWIGFWVLTHAYPYSLASTDTPRIWLPGSIGIGILQWLVFRRYLRSAYWWLIINPAAMIGIFISTWGFNQLVLRATGGGSNLIILNLAIPGLLYGVGTGWCCIVLCKQAEPAR